MPDQHQQQQQLEKVLRCLSLALDHPLEGAKLEQTLRDSLVVESTTTRDLLVRAGLSIRLRVAYVSLQAEEMKQFVRDGFPVAIPLASTDGLDEWLVVRSCRGNTFEVSVIQGSSVENRQMHWREIAARFRAFPNKICPEAYLAERLLACEHAMTDTGESTSAHGHDSSHGHHSSISPLRRLVNLISMDLGDVFALIIFGLTAGILGLATPLAVEWVVTTIGFGRYLQPLLVLAALLLTFLAFAGAMRVLQAVVVEVMQRRLMVRIIGDLSFRLPLVRPKEWEASAPSELMNRFFDIPTIQKAVASLLIDGVALILSTIIGMVLLAFYHPFLLGFDIVLLICMTVVTYLLGRGAVKTAKQESIVKYEMGHWLQDVANCSRTFRVYGGAHMAMERCNRLTVDYLDARKRHFVRLLRQVIFAVGLQVVASTALLGIGGWLVIDFQLTLGQLVASELVVTVIVGAFAKVGKSLETFYDLLAAMDKVGHLFDLAIDHPSQAIQFPATPAELRWQDLECHHPAVSSHFHFGSGKIASGEVHVILDSNVAKTSAFLEVLAGLREPLHGFSEVAGIDSRDAVRATDGRFISIVSGVDIFHGSVMENIAVGRPWIGVQEVRTVLADLGLLDELLSLPNGIETELQSGGFPLSINQKIGLVLARAIIAKPRLLLIDRMLDILPIEKKRQVHKQLVRSDRPWTLLVVTNDASLWTDASKVEWSD